MTQLLVSVKNSEEAMLVLAAGVDIIDLKDPSMGALGALDLAATKEIVCLVNGQKQLCATQVSATQVSATVGEHHSCVNALMADIRTRVDTGVDIIKIAVSDLFKQPDFYEEISVFTKLDVKIVAVFFADEEINLNLLPTLKNAGFYGAMLDTKNKQYDLLHVQQQDNLCLFTQRCHYYQLTSGLAGSLQPQYIDLLMEINPTYIGFRGGLCENSCRESALNLSKVEEVVNMFRNGNKNTQKRNYS